MSERSATLLAHMAEHLRFLSSTHSFWFTLDTSYDHRCQLARRDDDGDGRRRQRRRRRWRDDDDDDDDDDDGDHDGDNDNDNDDNDKKKKVTISRCAREAR